MKRGEILIKRFVKWLLSNLIVLVFPKKMSILHLSSFHKIKPEIKKSNEK